MIKLKPLETILKYWADSLPFKVRIHIFGGYLKGKPDRLVSDIDISLEFLHPYTKDERDYIWGYHHSEWESYLSECTCELIHLCQFEGDDSPKMQQYLKDGSRLVYEYDEKNRKVQELKDSSHSRISLSEILDQNP